MSITLNDFAVARATNDRRIAAEIDGGAKAMTINHTALALLGIAIVGYAVIRAMGVLG